MTTLPNLCVNIVQKDSRNANEHAFIEQNVYLKDWLDDMPNLGLILYFYPKDNTQGCTTQAKDFSTHKDAFLALGYRIVGVSRDSIQKHKNFIKKHTLSIPLISDADEALCRHFNVLAQKSMFGKSYIGIVRSTFIFNKDGLLIDSYKKVRTADHVNNLLTKLENLQ